MPELPLTLDQFASLSAQIDAGMPRASALAAANVSLEAWEASQTVWLERLAEQCAKRRYALHERYTRLFSEHRARAEELSRGLSRTGNAGRPSGPVVRLQLPRDHRESARDTDESSRLTPEPIRAARAPASLSLPAAPKLSVEQFAALRADLAASPESEHAAIVARYDLDPPTWGREEALWHERLSWDEPLRKQYVAQFRYLRALLSPR